MTDILAGAGGRAKLTFCSTRADAAAAMLPHIRAEDLYASLGGQRADEVRWYTLKSNPSRLFPCRIRVRAGALYASLGGQRADAVRLAHHAEQS